MNPQSDVVEVRFSATDEVMQPLVVEDTKAEVRTGGLSVNGDLDGAVTSTTITVQDQMVGVGWFEGTVEQCGTGGMALRIATRPDDSFMIWCFGACLFSHVVTGISVSYFDQSMMYLWLSVAVISSAYNVVLVEGDSDAVRFAGLDQAVAEPDTDIRLFGKPEVRGERRMGVALARGASVDEARDKAKAAAARISYTL